MLNGDGPKLSDKALDWLARRQFADVPAEQTKTPEEKARADMSGDAALVDWLFGGEDGPCDTDGDCD